MQEGYPVYERFHSWQGEGTHLGNQHSLSVSTVARCIVHGVTQQVPGTRTTSRKTLKG